MKFVKFAKFLVTSPILFYQKWISPLFPRCCKYYPTCSQYALKAVLRHGIFKGLLMAGWRILRCNPFSNGGIDEVPLTFCLSLKNHRNQ